MAERRRGRKINGWLVIDKPAGLTSAAVVSRVRRATGAAKAGHGGTLDPLATGVLPLALGEATKTVSYVMEGRKIYRFTVRWGEQRDTDDAEGQSIAFSELRPSRSEIVAALGRFQGEIEQIPPTFSAIKVAGERAYALARADRPVELPARTVHVARIELVDCPDADHAIFEVDAGKGVYMRALARDLGTVLGCLGHVVALRRLSVGPFRETEAISLEKLEILGHSVELQTYLLPVGAALAGIPALNLTEAEANSLQRGQPIAVLPVASRSPSSQISRDVVVCAMARGKPVALAQIKGGEIHPLRILNL
ncbi:MAG: tRNA pseudouridine(55) synthase TruB [Rhodospirillales bacterium]|nr:tRNA pseudouridine(55) synthase TruB [Rhodospirillales bacterium]